MANDSFKKLKEAFSSAPILGHPNLTNLALRLSEYTMKIAPKAGRLNVSADLLSRLLINSETFQHDSKHMDDKLVDEILRVNIIHLSGIDDEE